MGTDLADGDKLLETLWGYAVRDGYDILEKAAAPL
jgi:hypothetical protein